MCEADPEADKKNTPALIDSEYEFRAPMFRDFEKREEAETEPPSDIPHTAYDNSMEKNEQSPVLTPNARHVKRTEDFAPPQKRTHATIRSTKPPTCPVEFTFGERRQKRENKKVIQPILKSKGKTTKPAPFNFPSDRLLRKKTPPKEAPVFKAAPAPKNMPAVVKKSVAKATVPIAPALLSETRLSRRKKRQKSEENKDKNMPAISTE
eukprot:GHVN01012450.1.p3 GENE.GHVN01012450.1~~GHVN01012450.1.p3  ORF type:complete len:208 (-),score=34.76 GHVN01012450.1:1718-2341(-)